MLSGLGYTLTHRAPLGSDGVYVFILGCGEVLCWAGVLQFLLANCESPGDVGPPQLA